MSAMIDVYRKEIEAAINANDSKWIASIARSFCERCHYSLAWKITGLNARACPVDGLQAHVDIQLEDGSTASVLIGFVDGKRRLTVNGQHVSANSSADVVHALQVPCAFFDGIYYAIEGLARIARGEIRDQLARLDCETKQKRAAFDRECNAIEYAQKSLNKINKQLAVAQGRLAKAVEARKLVGDARSWTICPVDFNSRLIDASAMLSIPASEFISLHEAKKKLLGKSGVYFGWRVTDGKCVYVGKSINLGVRVGPHREELSDCKLTYIEMPAEHIHTWELFFIWLHRPERNKELREEAECALARN